MVTMDLLLLVVFSTSVLLL